MLFGKQNVMSLVIIVYEQQFTGLLSAIHILQYSQYFLGVDFQYSDLS